MSNDDAPKLRNPYEDLSPEQQGRGRKLLEEISLDKITLSFSIEDRDVNGRKKSAFYSVSASRRQADEETSGAGYTMDEALIVRTHLSRHVVKSVYEDAFRRKIIPFTEANVAERDATLRSYDERMVQLLKQQPDSTK